MNVEALKAEVAEAHAKMVRLQLEWGSGGARAAYLSARDEHEEAVAKLAAAQKREDDARAKVAAEEREAKESEIAERTARIAAAREVSARVAARAVVLAAELRELYSELASTARQADTDRRHIAELSRGLDRPVLTSAPSLASLVNDAKAAVQASARGVATDTMTGAAELVCGDRWLT